MSKQKQSEIERLKKDIEFVLPKGNTYIENDDWGRNMTNQIMELIKSYKLVPEALIDTACVEARIDQLNLIRHSDTRLNHGTIELMGAMSQELNKQKLALKATNQEKSIDNE